MPCAFAASLPALLASVLIALPAAAQSAPSVPSASRSHENPPPADNPLRDRLDSAVHSGTLELFAKTRVVGLTVGVTQGDGTTRIYDYGTTSLASGGLPTAKTRYPIASITKTFTAALLGEAVAEGRVRLDDDVRRYLPGDYPNLEHGGQPIRLSHLITHLSGLPRNLASASGRTPEYDRTRLFADLHRVVLDTAPGTRFSYSNAAAVILGDILEDLYHRPFCALVAERITQPLGMHDTGCSLADRTRVALATGYDSAGVVVDAERFASLQAAGALSSTVPDLLRYIRWQAAERDSAVRLSHVPHLTMGSYQEGLNWQMMSGAAGARTIWQDGGLPGYTSLAAFSPGLNVGVVILSAGHDYTSGLSVLASRILSALDARAVPLP